MIIAVVQARVSSTRLPGKVLKPILGKPMLALQLERVKRISRIDDIIVATSNQPEDEAIKTLSESLRLKCFQGSLNDVLARFYEAVSAYKPQHIVRITGDCPVIDPELVDELIDFHVKGKFDYSANCIEPTFPDGLDIEVVTWEALEQAYQEAKLPSEREHVMPFIRKRRERYHLGFFKNDQDYSYLRWTVDEQKDFELITKIYEALYPKNAHFNWKDILAFLDQNPVLKSYNVEYQRNEGMQKSLLKDQNFLKEC